jgi:internalin A
MVPKEFSMLTKLELLDISSNQIKVIPTEYSSLVNLRDLRASDNIITELSSAMFGPLTNLKILALFVNRISSLPIALTKSLTSLEGLELSNNMIKDLPRDFANLTNLRTLKLSRFVNFNIFDLLLVIRWPTNHWKRLWLA